MTQKIGYRCFVAGPMAKIPREGPYTGEPAGSLHIEMARGEYESAQLVVEAGNRAVKGLRAEVSELRGEGGTIPSSCVTVRQVGYVRTVKCKHYPQDRIGWWPDPLLELPEVDVPKGKVQPLWVTVYAPRETPAGDYRGTITLHAQNAPPKKIDLAVKVWDITLPQRPTFRAMALDGLQTEACYDLLLRHRMSPAYALRAWTWLSPQEPVKRRADGTWDFSEVDRIAEYCIPRGMNSFIIAQFPKPGRGGFPEEYPPDFNQHFAEFLKAYTAHLREKGWLKLGIVYNIDEAGPRHWDRCKENYRLSKSVAPETPVLQCLNEPKGVAALAGHADIWDAYITQYREAGIPARLKAGDDAIFAICCYPSTHPNLFTDYPAVDARMVGWLSWKAGVSGFEYWSATHWGDNLKHLPHGYLESIESDWQAATFSCYNGDGYLVYPGPNGRLLSSIRLENLRDGFEDWEMLALLKKKGGRRAQELLRLDGLCREDMSFTPDPALLMATRRAVAEALTAGPGGDSR